MEIPVGKGLVALIDDEEGPLIAGYRWHAYAQGRTHYAYACPTVNGKQRRVHMHRLILGLVGQPGGVDHCNGDGLDNRRVNLRLATQAENSRNTRMHRDNASGYKGVYRDTRSGRWCAGIKVDGKVLRLGRFADPIEAAWAYDQAALRYYGAFARTNGVSLSQVVLIREQAARAREQEAQERAEEQKRQAAARLADALSVTGLQGHTMGAPAVVAGVRLRQCTLRLRTMVEREGGCFGGTALTQPCAGRPSAPQRRHQPGLLSCLSATTCGAKAVRR